MSPWRKQLNGAVFSSYKNTTTAFLTWCPFWKLSVAPEPQTPVHYSVNDALPGKNIECTKSIFECWYQWHSVISYCLMFSLHWYQGMLTIMFFTDSLRLQCAVYFHFFSKFLCFLSKVHHLLIPRSRHSSAMGITTLRIWLPYQCPLCPWDTRWCQWQWLTTLEWEPMARWSETELRLNTTLHHLGTH